MSTLPVIWEPDPGHPKFDVRLFLLVPREPVFGFTGRGGGDEQAWLIRRRSTGLRITHETRCPAVRLLLIVAFPVVRPLLALVRSLFSWCKQFKIYFMTNKKAKDPKVLHSHKTTNQPIHPSWNCVSMAQLSISTVTVLASLPSCFASASQHWWASTLSNKKDSPIQLATGKSLSASAF